MKLLQRSAVERVVIDLDLPRAPLLPLPSALTFGHFPLPEFSVALPPAERFAFLSIFCQGEKLVVRQQLGGRVFLSR